MEDQKAFESLMRMAVKNEHNIDVLYDTLDSATKTLSATVDLAYDQQNSILRLTKRLNKRTTALGLLVAGGIAAGVYIAEQFDKRIRALEDKEDY